MTSSASAPVIGLPITGGRVVIDHLGPDDAAALAASHSDPDNARHQGWTSPLPVDEAHAFITANATEQPFAPGSAAQLAIRERDGGPLVGDLYVQRDAATPTVVEVGITIVPGAHRRGLAAATVTTVIDAIRTSGAGIDTGGAGISTVRAVVDVDNVASRGLFESLGFAVVEVVTAASTRRDGSIADEVVFERAVRDPR